MLFSFDSNYFAMEEVDNVVIASFTQSRYTDDENVELLGRELFTLVDKCACRKLVLCLERVEYITSALLGKLITLHRKLHRFEGTLILAGIQGGVQEVMRTSRLLEYFNTAGDVDSAMTMLKS